MVVNGAGATLLVAGACLFMNNLREGLGDVAENVDATNEVDFGGHGMGFISMNVCMFFGLIWLCRLTFWKQAKDVNMGKGRWIASGAIVGAGVLACYAIATLGSVTAQAV